MDMNDEQWEAHLRRMFAVYMDGGAAFFCLPEVLGSIQKSHNDYPGGWMQFVLDFMVAMDLDDAGQFPSEWFPEEDGQ